MNLIYHKKVSGQKMSISNYAKMQVITDNIIKNISSESQVKKIQSSVNTFIERVCAFSKITVEQIRSDSREREYIVPRQIAMKIIKQYFNKTLRETGDMFNRDHSSVLHSIKVVDNLIEYDKNFRNTYLEIFNLQYHEPLNNN